ncbi:MAG TPA: HNH endonuclease signature motif containing protein [Acidimicrobiales bacterium]
MFGVVECPEVQPLDRAVDGLERIVFDGPSRVLDLGHARRFTGAARRAVEVRDRRCTGPGCDVPAEQCEIDHRWRHSDGGPTHPDNGQALCGHHNRRREPTASPPRRPPPSPTGHDDPAGLPPHIDGAAHLDLLRARIRDRLRHDPHWAA